MEGNYLSYFIPFRGVFLRYFIILFLFFSLLYFYYCTCVHIDKRLSISFDLTTGTLIQYLVCYGQTCFST